uniref:BZIP domain-containing protein n=1 Tax=Brassica oleracea var. oleracea TaxID=109376 RepID=A0A0D3B6Z1_BRAOL
MKDSRKHLHHTDIYSRSLSAIPVKRGSEYRILSEGRLMNQNSKEIERELQQKMRRDIWFCLAHFVLSLPQVVITSLAMVQPETWLQNERELKRERRKQSNRESAKRSRLRKQAETEELARKVEALTAENMASRSELNQLNEKSDKLRGANAALLNNLKSSEPEKSVSGNKNSGSGCNESNSSSKLHQLLDTKPRADAVAAG